MSHYGDESVLQKTLTRVINKDYESELMKSLSCTALILYTVFLWVLLLELLLGGITAALHHT